MHETSIQDSGNHEIADMKVGLHVTPISGHVSCYPWISVPSTTSCEQVANRLTTSLVTNHECISYRTTLV
jgi:hypothetical protein